MSSSPRLSTPDGAVETSPDARGPRRQGDRARRSGAARPGHGFVAVTVGFAALGAYLGRDLSGATGLVLFIGAFASSSASTSPPPAGREQLAIGLLFGLGLLLGLAVAPVIADYADADPSALWQAAGVTAAFIAALGAYGYATRRDLSSWGRTLFWALLGLIVFGIVAIFVAIPDSNIIYAVAGLGIFGAFTIFDFNRLRRQAPTAPS